MASKSYQERIDELQKKQAQLKAQEKQLRAKQSKEERNRRTKRLIEVGATVEKVLGHPIERGDLPKLAAFLQQQEDRGEYFSRAMADKKENIDGKVFQECLDNLFDKK